MKCRWRNTGEWNEWINTGNREVADRPEKKQMQDRRGGRIRLVRSTRIQQRNTNDTNKKKRQDHRNQIQTRKDSLWMERNPDEAFVTQTETCWTFSEMSNSFSRITELQPENELNNDWFGSLVNMT